MNSSAWQQLPYRRLLQAVPWPLLVANALFAAFLVLKPGSAFVMKAGSDVAGCLIPLGAAIWCAWACHAPSSRELSRRQKAALCCVYLGVLTYSVGMVVWIYYEVFLRQEIPMPSWADAAFLVSYPMLLAGNLLIPSRPVPNATRARSFLDSLLVMTALFTFSWYFVLGPNLLNNDQSPLIRVLSVSYPLGDMLVVISLLILTARDSGREFRTGIILCSLGLTALIVVDSVYAYLTLRDLYQSGMLMDCGWTVGYSLLAWGVIRMRQAFLTAPVEGPLLTRPPLARWRSFLPYTLIPAVAGLVVYVGVAHGNPHLSLGVYVGSALLIVLLLLRQFLSITENHQLNAELSAARDAAEAGSRAKSEFLANMSHELRTPLNAILGYSEMLREEAEETGNSEALADLNKIHSAGKHLLGLISDILDLSKIEAGKMELHLESFSVPELMTDLADTVQPLVRKNGNTFTIDCPEGVGMLYADATKVRQSLFNLLSNAAKFTHEGSIHLTVTREPAPDGDWLTFGVTDSGIGISPEQLARLFQEFVQADGSTTRKYGGTGLGLTITRRFSQMMGGDVTVVSEVGKGSTFTLHLPAVVQLPAVGSGVKAAGPAPPREAAVSRAIAPTATVLVIDDDPTVHDLMRRTLTKEGYQVVAVRGGEAGLQVARELQPSAITLDVMPDLDGWSVFAALKQDPELAHIPVILLTARDRRSRAMALGAVEYLPKPLDRGRLLSILRRWQAQQPPTKVVS